jgi:hypothetical protein
MPLKRIHPLAGRRTLSQATGKECLALATIHLPVTPPGRATSRGAGLTGKMIDNLKPD